VSRVDGLLFINLAEGEWADMGITNRFHVRKLQLIMVQYRARYERKKKKMELGEDEYEEDEDEIGTEYDPDDLSDMIRQEGMSESESEDDIGDVRSSYCSDDECLWCSYLGMSLLLTVYINTAYGCTNLSTQEDDDFDYDDEDEEYVMTEEERIEAEFDKKHLSMELVAAGDDTNYPVSTNDYCYHMHLCLRTTLLSFYERCRCNVLCADHWRCGSCPVHLFHPDYRGDIRQRRASGTPHFPAALYISLLLSYLMP
jgi:hypothetical protein